MIAYALLIAVLLAAATTSIIGAAHARAAGHRGWYAFHTTLTIGALIFTALMAVYAAPVARGL